MIAAAFLLLTAQASVAPPSAEAMGDATRAFGTCVESNIAAVPASATPEAGAARVRAACANQIARLEQLSAQLINSNTQATPEQKTAWLAQMRTNLGAVEGQLAEMIRNQRAQPASN